MIRIYDVETAKRTILNRRLLHNQPYPQGVLDGISKKFGESLTPEQAVSRILDEIQEEGDAALKRWTLKLDGVELDTFEVPQSAMKEALASLEPSLTSALKRSIERIHAFHRRQPVSSWSTEALGGMVGQRFTPIHRVGIYVPGGSAPLPSSLLMAIIPAQVAGVPEVIVCTPPKAHPIVLAAAELTGVRKMYQIGGTQAVGAMAFGTESIKAVDKIVGAGNLFVTLAKRQVFGVVGIDGLAGPTETMVIADQTANPVWAAADLLAQAEHDPLASAILLTPDGGMAQAVVEEVNRQLPTLPRQEILKQSLAHHSGVVLTPNLLTAVELANAYAPEHLCLSVADPTSWIERIYNAGGLFIGEHSFEVLGDYVAGPSHIMPTGGTARFASPVNVLDFMKITSLIGLDAKTSSSLSALANEIAKAESLFAHAHAADERARSEKADKV